MRVEPNNRSLRKSKRTAHLDACIEKMNARKEEALKPPAQRIRKTSMKHAMDAIKESGLTPDEIVALVTKPKRGRKPKTDKTGERGDQEKVRAIMHPNESGFAPTRTENAPNDRIAPKSTVIVFLSKLAAKLAITVSPESPDSGGSFVCLGDADRRAGHFNRTQ